MKKKNKGSSLITVVIIFTILITIGTSLLSMTVVDYKLRTKESKRIENLYASDSGLDIAYDIMIKTVNCAIKFGDREVQALKSKDGNPDSPNDKLFKDYKDKIYSWKHYNDGKDKDNKISNEKIKEEINKIKEKMEILINEEFRRTFKNFVYVNEDTINGSSEYKPNKLKESIEYGKYVDSVNGIKEEDLVCKEVEINSKRNTPKLSVEVFDPKIIDKEEIYEINVTSTFQTNKDNEDLIGTNMRKVQATYNIVVPDYKDVSFSESTSKSKNNVILNDKVMVVGRNMTVNERNKVEVNGDVFVWGDTPAIKNKVYDKYKGGINLKSCDIDFNGEVVTEKTFNIEDYVKSNIKGNLYARNVYLGNTNGNQCENSNFNVKESENVAEKDRNIKESGQVILDNDITLKSKNTNVNIEKFYGINDKNIKYGNNFNSSYKSNERTSSSIIVNGDDRSNIIVNNKAYIMGVAHIDTDSEYKTGESTGIKGNYIAYATPLNDEEKLRYYKPLQLLDEDNVLEKSKHFTEYWKNKLSDINTGGIQLPEETYSVGAIVYRDKYGNIQIKDSSYTMEMESEINKKRLEYASKVYAMGKKVGMDSYDVSSDLPSPINSLMNLNKIPLDYDINDEIVNNEKAIFNNDKNKTIIIRGKNSSSNYYDNNSNLIHDENKIIIDVKSGEIDAVVATNGDVIIDGELNFNGNIITEGNLNIQGNEEKNIKYDKDLCERITSSNDELFYAVFSDFEEVENIETDETTLPSKDDLEVQYDLNKFLKTKLWKIIK